MQKRANSEHSGDIPRFDLGANIVATPDALTVLERNGIQPIELLKRHVCGDWGTLCDEDRQANEEALKSGARILSSYPMPDGESVWIITDCEVDAEHHRYATTILLPSNY